MIGCILLMMSHCASSNITFYDKEKSSKLKGTVLLGVVPDYQFYQGYGIGNIGDESLTDPAKIREYYNIALSKFQANDPTVLDDSVLKKLHLNIDDVMVIAPTTRVIHYNNENIQKILKETGAKSLTILVFAGMAKFGETDASLWIYVNDQDDKIVQSADRRQGGIAFSIKYFFEAMVKSYLSELHRKSGGS